MMVTHEPEASLPLTLAADSLPLPLYTVAQIRPLEQAAMAGMPPHALMARAGQAIAQFILERLPASYGNGPRVWLAAGPGNNGGDALACATELHLRGVSVEVLLPSPPTAEDARWALERARWASVPITTEWRGAPAFESQPAWFVDGLFGIGLGRPLEGVFAQVADYLSHCHREGHLVLALDVPSGLDSDTGLAPAHSPVVNASHTLSFIGAKPGLFTGAGRDHAGSVWVAPLGLPAALEAPAHIAHLIAPVSFSAHLPRRSYATHKGSFGSLAVIGGADGMAGAPILAARAALYAGAGKVHVALLTQRGPAFDSVHPELMINTIAELDWASLTALAVGPGMGQSAAARQQLKELLTHDLPKVLDADALNLIAGDAELGTLLRQHSDGVVLTPHPLEAARLLGQSTLEIQQDRLRAAHALAERYRCVVVLKGSGTVIASPEGPCALNPTGNAGLATGGTGDVLSGLLGALLAQGCATYPAALAAVYLHGLSADVLTSSGAGPTGLTAGELAPMFRTLLNRAVREADTPPSAPTPTADPL